MTCNARCKNKTGTNNREEPESIAAGIGIIVKLINAKSPSSKIILLSILPRGSGLYDENTIRNNAVNEIIKKYHGYLKIRYLDLGQYFINRNGKLKEELFLPDYLHLSMSGYNLWKDKIMEIIE